MKKDSRKYNIYHGVMAGGRWVLFAIVSFIILFPVYWIFISSITPSGELFKTPIDYLPDHPTLESYKFLIENVGLFIKSGKYSIDRRSYTGYQYCILCNGCIRILTFHYKRNQYCFCIYYCNYVNS